MVSIICTSVPLERLKEKNINSLVETDIKKNLPKDSIPE